MIKSTEEDRSHVTYLVREIKRLVADRVESKVEVIRQDRNSVSHALVNMGLSDHIAEFWALAGPRDIPRLCNVDCNPYV
jgi:hypothetical protein